MTRGMIGLCAIAVIFFCIMGPTVAVAESNKQETDSKGTTLKDIGRGLKSAVQNVGEEIPKIGPAIGATFKKITGKESDKTSSQGSQKGKK